MHVQSDGDAAVGSTPFFSICIPQYNRTSFIVEAISWLGRQTFRDVEICVSDDRSTDGREEEVVAALRATGLRFTYHKQEKNLRYDGNLRGALALSSGRYCYLLGNDDRPATETELQQLHDDIVQHGEIGVAIGNFYSLTEGTVSRRMQRSGLVGAGPWVAAANFRNFSFVSGVVLHGERARALATDRWDGSEMYQMYIGCRIIAEGLPLLAIERMTVAKDILVPGEEVDSSIKRPRLDPCPIVERKHTLHLLGQLVLDAVSPPLAAAERPRMMQYLLDQILMFTYPYWLMQYRRSQSWNYAAGMCLGMRPRNLDPQHQLGAVRGARTALLFGLVSAAGLSVPLTAFERSRPALHRLAKLSSLWSPARSRA